MNKSYLKNILRDMKSTLGKVFSIGIMVVLATMIIVGLNLTGQSMRLSLDSSLKLFNYPDLIITSTYPLEEKDRQILANDVDVKYISYIKAQDMKIGSQIFNLKAFDQIFPKIKLTLGKNITNNQEILLEDSLSTKYQLGDYLDFNYLNKHQKTNNSLKNTKFKVVGFFKSATNFIKNTVQISPLGKKQISGLALIDSQNFNSSQYNEINISYHKTKDMYKLSNDYFDYTKSKQDVLKSWFINRPKEILTSIKDKAFKEIEKAQNEIKLARNKLKDHKDKLEKTKQEIDDGFKAYHQQVQYLSPDQIKEHKLDLMHNKLLASQEVYNKALKEFKLKEQEVLKEIADHQNNLDDEKIKLNNLIEPKYSISTILDNQGIDTYYRNSLNMDSLSKTFPSFFYLVTILVTMTTMKRYIEEQRTINGILKSLGYKESMISQRFYIYGLIPTVIGAIIGSLIGRNLLLRLIFKAYSTGFNIVVFELSNYLLLRIFAVLLSTLLVFMTVYVHTRESVKAIPAVLLKPKVPKTKGKILLERIKPLWQKLSFIQKVTARNIFRYKSRMFMTIFGVAGCSGLIFFGFAMFDSLKDTSNIQQKEISHYKTIVLLDENAQEKDWVLYKEKTKDFKVLNIRLETVKLHTKDQSQELKMIVVGNNQKLNDFVHLRDLKGHSLNLKDHKIILSQKASINLGISKNRAFKLNIDHQSYNLSLNAIFENYVGDYLYLNQDTYENIFKKQYKTNANYVLQEPKTITPSLEKLDVVRAILNTGKSYEFMDSLLENLSLVIVVITLISSLLAGVVLYNITDINVSERKKELATIKVLGFYTRELTSYIYREIFILSLIGIGCGFGIGYGIFRYIIALVAPKEIFLSSKLHLMSFMVSALITLGLLGIMFIYIYKKLSKIDMSEAMSTGQ